MSLAPDVLTSSALPPADRRGAWTTATRRWKGPRIGPVITRVSEREGGDDKITCAGTAQAYNECMDFVSQV